MSKIRHLPLYSFMIRYLVVKLASFVVLVFIHIISVVYIRLVYILSLLDLSNTLQSHLNAFILFVSCLGSYLGMVGYFVTP